MNLSPEDEKEIKTIIRLSEISLGLIVHVLIIGLISIIAIVGLINFHAAYEEDCIKNMIYYGIMANFGLSLLILFTYPTSPKK